jgi:hypothetical protein
MMPALTLRATSHQPAANSLLEASSQQSTVSSLSALRCAATLRLCGGQASAGGWK